MNEKQKFSTLRFTGRFPPAGFTVSRHPGFGLPGKAGGRARRSPPGTGCADCTRLVAGPAERLDAGRLERASVPLQHLYNGALIANPHPQDREVTEQWAGHDLQLTITASVDSLIPEPSGREPCGLSDTPDMGPEPSGLGKRAAPVLWTEWRLREGLVLRQEVFAHVPGGKRSSRY